MCSVRVGEAEEVCEKVLQKKAGQERGKGKEGGKSRKRRIGMWKTNQVGQVRQGIPTPNLDHYRSNLLERRMHSAIPGADLVCNLSNRGARPGVALADDVGGGLPVAAEVFLLRDGESGEEASGKGEGWKRGIQDGKKSAPESHVLCQSSVQVSPPIWPPSRVTATFLRAWASRSTPSPHLAPAIPIGCGHELPAGLPPFDVASGGLPRH